MNFSERHYNGANNHVNSKYILDSIYLIFTAQKQEKTLIETRKMLRRFSYLIFYVEIQCK